MKKTKVYSFNKETGEYEGIKIIKGNLPKNCTTIEPPKEENKAAFWEDGEWVLYPDFRYKTFVNKETGDEIFVQEAKEDIDFELWELVK
jgi:hypothetical protein